MGQGMTVLCSLLLSLPIRSSPVSWLVYLLLHRVLISLDRAHVSHEQFIFLLAASHVAGSPTAEYYQPVWTSTRRSDLLALQLSGLSRLSPEPDDLPCSHEIFGACRRSNPEAPRRSPCRAREYCFPMRDKVALSTRSISGYVSVHSRSGLHPPVYASQWRCRTPRKTWHVLV